MNVLRGVGLLARGHGVGINYFSPGGGPLLAALAPTLAVAIIACGVAFQAQRAEWGMGLVRMLVPLTCTLLQLVVSHAYARFVRREGLWSRYATASLWCAWLPLILMFFLVALLKICLPGGNITGHTAIVLSVAVQLYGLWLTWYISRVGLLLTRKKAAVNTVIQLLSVALLLVVLIFLPPHYDASKDILSIN